MNINMKIYHDKNNVIVRDSIESDIFVIANDMRQADRDEIFASHHKKPIDALREGFKNSTLCFTVLWKGTPVAMFGTAPLSILSDEGSIWLLGSNDFCYCYRALVRHSKRFIEMMLVYYPKLQNFIDVRNTVSLRWLEACGAKIEEAVNYGIEQLPFHRFTFARRDYALS